MQALKHMSICSGELIKRNLVYEGIDTGEPLRDMFDGVVFQPFNTGLG